MTARPVAVSGGLRLLRGVLLAVTAAALAITAHGLAGGGAPDTSLTVLACLALGWIGTAVADRRHSPAAIIAALGGSQIALHVLLSMPHELSAHHHPATTTSVVHGPAMLAAHTLAAVLTGLLLAAADTALLTVVAAVSAVLPRRPLPVPARTPLLIPVVAPPGDVTLDRLLTRICARRGPPRVA